MTQNNLYMEDDEMRLYVDVQPLFIDELENSKNAAAASAASAAQSEAAASNWKNDIEDYKTDIELFYAQASDDLTDLYEDSISDIATAKDNALGTLQTQNNTIIGNINTAKQTAINDIGVSAQSYVNQARSYAEQAQDTVDNRVSLEHLNQSKALETGDVSDDSDVLVWVDRLAHSTYCGDQPDNASPLDAKKFTYPNGHKPTITSDGIASVFSSSNYLTVPKEIFNSVGTNSWSIEIAGQNNFAYSTTMNTPNPLFSGSTHTWDDTTAFFMVGALNDNPFWFHNINLDVNGVVTRTSILNGENNYDIIPSSYYGKDYKYTLSYDAPTKTYTSKLVFVDDNQTYTGTLQSDYYLAQQNNDLIIGYNYGDYKLNLKSVLVKIAGVPVLSGNKTGIDTVYSGNYSPANTTLPTISTDGIASSFTGSNFIKLPSFNFNDCNSWEMYIPFTYSTTSNGGTLQQLFRGANYPIAISINSSTNKLGTNLSSNGTSWDILTCTDGQGSLVYENNKSYLLKVVFTGSKYGFYVSQDNGQTYTTEVEVTSSTKVYGSTDYYIGCQVGQADRYWTGSVDLAGTKIIIDNKTAYRPMLLIPYTESKTGSKIVDSVYRDRVADMYGQYGYAPYYTLSDADFALPMGEIYGMIENLRKLIIERTTTE